MIGHTSQHLPFNVTLHRKSPDRHNPTYQPLGVMVTRKKASFGYRLTIRRPDGSEFVMDMAKAGKLWHHEDAKVEADTLDDKGQIAAWVEERAREFSKQAEMYHAGTDDEAFYEDLATHVNSMADSIRSGEWKVEVLA